MSTTLNPYCHAESPFQTSFNGQASYVIPKIDVLISGVYRDRPVLNGTPNNASTDQLGGSLPANFTFTATDAIGTAIAQQIGRPLTGGPFTVNLITPGTLYGGGDIYGERNRSIDLSLKKIIRIGEQAPHGGARHLQPDEQRHHAVLQHDVRRPSTIPRRNGWQTSSAYMNPRVFRLAAEFSF